MRTTLDLPNDLLEEAMENVNDALAATIEAYQDLGKQLPKNVQISDAPLGLVIVSHLPGASPLAISFQPFGLFVAQASSLPTHVHPAGWKPALQKGHRRWRPDLFTIFVIPIKNYGHKKT